MSHKLLISYISKYDDEMLKGKTIIEIGGTREVAEKTDGTIFT